MTSAEDAGELASPAPDGVTHLRPWHHPQEGKISRPCADFDLSHGVVVRPRNSGRANAPTPRTLDRGAYSFFFCIIVIFSFILNQRTLVSCHISCDWFISAELLNAHSQVSTGRGVHPELHL